MFNYLYGTIAEIGINTIVVDVNGVGYELLVSHPNNYRACKEAKAKMQVFTYMQVKEDDVVLYGFDTKEEKRLFLRLISVSGIGPKTTIGLLSQSSVTALVQAIETSNTSYLKKLPGIGPKAAQQIILDLKGKLVLETGDEKAVQESNEALSDVREALKNLGFKAAAIDHVLGEIKNENLTSEEYLRRALQLLRR